MKKLTLKKLRTLALSKKCAKSNCYNELDLIIVPDKEDTKSYEKIKFIDTGEATIYKKKKSKKNPRTMKDYNKGKIVYGWLNDTIPNWESTIGKVIDDKNVLFH